MVLPHGQVFVGSLFGLLLLLFMCVLYHSGGTLWDQFLDFGPIF